jgi:phosphatidate phosphatase APP1
MSGLISGGGERGARRKKLAGYLKAANEIRQSYQQSYSEKWTNGEGEEDTLGIPGAFPDVAIVSHGDEQLILFPSYAKNHTKERPEHDIESSRRNDPDSPGDEEYWKREWEKFEDDKAVVDVDVRGWIYSPHRGPISRKNRMLIGLARKLSGIPAPQNSGGSPELDSSSSLHARHQEHEYRREQETIAREAEKILERGEEEEHAASRGKYSEKPKDSDDESIYNERGTSGSQTPARDEPLGPGYLTKRASWNHPDDMSQAELMTANAHLMARIKPFMTNPLVSTPITIFFYDENKSTSRVIQTNDAGHFNIRAALDFIPTHIRVLASEHLSATEEVKITQPKGVSVISDVDDTIKHSSIGSGAREIFRNAFIRDLGDLTIEGVKEWYNTMYDMGVGLHYVSNSPWQLFPVMVSFFRIAGLPPGSYHLKQYSGMLQGIFEPVAERKKGTLERIMRDFPERRFILIGDSGEADLEVYTDVVLANPGKVLAIYIRDVTTPENHFFDSAMGPLSEERVEKTLARDFSGDNRFSAITSWSGGTPERRPALPPRIVSEAVPQTSSGPAMGKLIDFDDESDEIESVHSPHRRVMPRSASDFEPLSVARRKSAPEGASRVPPPRPSKPLALRGVSTAGEAPGPIARGVPPPPPPPRRTRPKGGSSSPLSQQQSAQDVSVSNDGYVASAKQKVSAAYNALPEMSSYMPGRTYSDDAPSLPPRRAGAGSSASSITKRLSWNSNGSDDERVATAVPVNKKFELWKRRFKNAKGILDAQGVTLRTWRVGSDVCLDAVQLIEKAMTSMGVEGYGNSAKNGKTGDGGGEMKTKDMKR